MNTKRCPHCGFTNEYQFHEPSYCRKCNDLMSESSPSYSSAHIREEPRRPIVNSRRRHVVEEEYDEDFSHEKVRIPNMHQMKANVQVIPDRPIGRLEDVACTSAEVPVRGKVNIRPQKEAWETIQKIAKSDTKFIDMDDE